MGSITFFGELHIGTGTEAIFFSDHTDFFLPLAIGHLSCRVLKVCDLSISTGKLYFRSLVFKSLDEVRKSSPNFSPKQRKSLRSDVNFLRGMLLTLFSKFLAID